MPEKETPGQEPADMTAEAQVFNDLLLTGFHLRLCASLGHRSSKMFFGNAFLGENPPKFLFLKSIPGSEKNYGANFHEIINYSLVFGNSPLGVTGKMELLRAAIGSRQESS